MQSDGVTTSYAILWLSITLHKLASAAQKQKHRNGMYQLRYYRVS